MIELVGRAIRWFINRIGAPTLLRLVLLTLTLVSVERGLIAIVGHLHPEWLIITVLFAVITGWRLGRSRLPGWRCGLVAPGIGLAWLLLSVGQMSASIDKFVAALPPILKMFIFHVPLKIGPLQEVWSALAEDFVTLFLRLSAWLHNAGASTLILDPGIITLVWALALWLVSVWAAWWIRRKETLAVALLPATTLLVYNIYYTNSKLGILWLVLAGGGWILLQGLENYLKARRRWQINNLGQVEVEPMLALSVILLAAGLMLAGGLFPSISIEKVSDTFQQIFQNQQDKTLAESLGLQKTPAAVSAPLSGIGLWEAHEIGPGPHLSQDVVMFVTVKGYAPPLPAAIPPYTQDSQPDTQYYWRSQIYDFYNGHAWIDRNARIQVLPANSPYHPEVTTLPPNYRLVRQDVQRLQPMDGALFVSGDLLSVNQSSTAAWRTTGDLILARTVADTFTAVSRLQYVSVDQMRQAGKKYPETLQNYLGLPDELPGRVRDLAVRLTIDQPTPYDQVMAIQNFLRQFPYSLDVPGTPSNRDTADYFLFDLQKGYCDYFSTTMAVMLRAAGIPARLVIGFSSGTYDYHAQRFVVEEENAHSWVEVYFPGIGWVEFEPTPGQAPFPHPGGTAGQASPGIGIPDASEATGSGFSRINWQVLRRPAQVLEIIIACLVFLVLLGLLLPLESWSLYLRPADKAIAAIQQRLYRLGRAWDLAPDPSRTPHEFAGAFSARLDRFSRDQRLAPLTTSLQADVNWMTALYTRLLFSPHPPTQEEHHRAVRNLARIRKCLRKIRNY